MEIAKKKRMLNLNIALHLFISFFVYIIFK